MLEKVIAIVAEGLGVEAGNPDGYGHEFRG